MCYHGKRFETIYCPLGLFCARADAWATGMATGKATGMATGKATGRLQKSSIVVRRRRVRDDNHSARRGKAERDIKKVWVVYD